MIKQTQLAGLSRRRFAGWTALLSAAVAVPARVWAWARPEAAFIATGIDEALAGLGGTPTVHDAIQFTTPDIAENGAVVPITVSTSLPNIETIAIIAEKNPAPLAASFDLGGSSEGYVSTRIKMGKTSNVVAVVKSDGKLYSASKEVKVTIGGCGG